MTTTGYIAKDGELLLPGNHEISGSVKWQSPSNIALVKYWGKYGKQLPLNPSISMTLKHAFSEVEIEYVTRKETQDISLNLTFDGQPHPKFRERLYMYLHAMIPVFPFLRQLHLKVQTKNSFPHSAGIASSASGMSAVALALCSIENDLFGDLNYTDDFYRKASFCARLGSGSASRSIYGKFVSWGKTDLLPGSADEYASPLNVEVHPLFDDVRDAIMIVSAEEKKVSSSAGHALMDGHPFAKQRFQQAENNLMQLLTALTEGDFGRFAGIVENEALSLHAMMMTSSPSYLLFKSETISILDKIVNFREQNKMNMCYSLDAGPNIHLLYHGKDQEMIREFIKNELQPFCENSQWIDDAKGNGPVRINNCR